MLKTIVVYAPTHPHPPKLQTQKGCWEKNHKLLDRERRKKERKKGRRERKEEEARKERKEGERRITNVFS